MENKILLVLSVIVIVLTSKGLCEIICTQHNIVVTVNEVESVNYDVFIPSCSDTDGGTLAYAMIAGTPNKPYKKKFKIDSTSGIIKIKAKLNADFLHKFSIDIGVTSSSGASDVIKLGIKVLNYNDNYPVLKNLPASLTITEDTPIGFKVATCNANDKDKEDVNLHKFYILDHSPEETDIWHIDRDNCDLYLNGKLDFENKTSYTIEIEAVDTGEPPKTSYPETIVIYVADVNDNYPVCPQYYKVVSLPEDTNLGEKIDGIACSDEDSGANGDITYSLSASNDVNTMSKFQVDPTTGDISLKSQVDYETQKAYEVKIDVADSGTLIALTSTVVYGIVVSDVDDNIPTWSENPIFLSVSEVAPLGNIVYTVSANDSDQANTDASKIKYEMTTPPNPDWFQLDPNTGAISVKAIMNRLTAAWVTMDVIAYSDKPKGFNTVTINITIVDENNVSPSFKEVFYQGNLTENVAPGTYILTVSAHDPEDGLNGDIEYYINSPIFKVDSISGDVSLKTSVDFETDTVHSLKIEARDKGTPTQSGFAFLLINVNPVNEYDPIINGPTSSIDILEDSEPGTLLYDFNATDADDGMDGFVTFSIQTALSPFTIDPNTGIFRVASSLDREFHSSWDIIVAATDSSETNPRSSTTIVTINIGDINDNNPICDPLSTTTVPLTHPINTRLATIDCTDADIGGNAEFTFTKISGDVKGAFGVDATSGDITLLKKPTETSYTLSIEIKDKGSPSLSVVIAFNIIAEIQFNFTQLPTTINVQESTLPNEELIDIDTCCIQGVVKYEILSGNEDGHVILDPSSGKLILRSMFDYEAKKSFSYRIRGVTVSTNTQIEEVLNVNVEDSNDNDPKFSTSFQETSVVENTPPSTSILNVKATDLDAGINGEITYNISGGNEFSVDSSGNLLVALALDAEQIPQYNLEITATDNGNISRSSVTTVVVNVKNYNEFSPTIINMVNGVVVEDVPEDSALGSPIFKIEAEDQDIDTILTYSITAGNTNNAFVIDDKTGNIFLATILDRETTPQYNITIQVTTQKSETVSALVMINILDVNDNDPKFDQDVYQLEVTDGDPANKVLTTFDIKDADSEVNADINSVTITDGDPSNHFKIIGTQILTNIQVDYNTDQLYILTLKATDGGVTPRSGYTRVTIKVLPKYKPPKFLTNSYSEKVLEDVVPSDIIYDMDATSEGATEGVTGTMTYAIQTGDPDNDFVISQTTGVIQIASQLDFERQKTYELVIIAKSNEDPLLISSSTLTISVQNVNDNRPIFDKALYDFDIDENAGTGDFVGKVIVTDADEAPFNSITYSLGIASGSTDFIIDSSGNIKVNKPLSFMSQNIYSIPVIADDTGSKSYSLIIIKINDINDHSPTFTPSSFSVDVVESMGIGNTFFTVKAEDLDTGINGEIKYTLVSGNYGGQLALDSDSGALTVATNLDRETHDRFDLVIRAEDKGTPKALSGTLSLTVNVADVNDLSPTFSSTFEDVTIERLSTAPGSSVLTIAATDGDLGDNALIVYEITSGNDDNLFLIDVSSGLIKTAADISAAKNEYTLVITAKDKGIPSRTGTIIVKVQIIPLLSSSSDQTMQIKEELTSGEVVGSVSPTHAATLAVNYQIISGNFKNSFNINPSTGQITTARKLDREEYPNYILTVRVTDSGPDDYTRSVTVEVEDINDNDPVITTSNTDINVVENTPAGQTVASFTVNDPDAGDNGLVDLKISDIPSAAGVYFQIVGNLLKIKKALDYESITSITFQILAVDRGDTPRTGIIEVIVNVIDVDDGIVYTEDGEAPSVFISRETSFYAADGEFVTKLTPSEYNIDSNLSVSFKSLNREGIFAVAEDGVVTVQKRGLLEPDSKYFVWVVATADAVGDKKSILGLLRIDTFHPNKHVVSLESSSDVTFLESNRIELTQKLKTLLSNDQSKIWKIREHGGTSRRKLLAAGSETLIYVIEGQPLEDLTNVEATKTFVEVDSLLNTLRADPNNDTPKSTLTSTNYPIIAVNAHSEVISDGEDTEESFISSINGIITMAMLGLIILIIIIIIIIVIVYKKKKRQRENMNESSEELMPPEPVKEKRKIEITKPTGLGLKKEKEKANKTTTNTSLGVTDTLPGKTLRSTSVSPSRLTPITPVGTPTPRTPTEILITDDKSSKSKKSERKILSLPPKKASTIDPASGINNDSVDNRPVIPKRSDGPIVNRGKQYDGIGYDQEKQQRYAYNTRTGSTLWMEKNKGLGTGPQARNLKKKPEPKLTVVGEAPGSDTPNLALNRSIPMTNK